MPTLTVYGTALASRFLLGSAGYPSPQVLREAITAMKEKRAGEFPPMATLHRFVDL